MGEIYSLVYEYKRGDKEKIMDLIDRFNPLIKKLQRNSHYEDMKNELVLFILKLIPKIPIDIDDFKEDKYIISYISKSIKNEYIKLNKKNQKICNSEIYLDNYISNIKLDEEFEYFIFNETIKILTEKERDVIKNIYLYGFTEAQIGRARNISRQAIHKTHTRALNKLKLCYKDFKRK